MSIIDWNTMDSNLIYNKYRALYGLWPLTTTWHGVPMKLIDICKYNRPNLKYELKPGRLMYDKQRHKLFVKCGGKGGYVLINKLKIPDHKKMSGKDFFNGFMYKKSENEWKFDT